ncbi:MAG: hypothetical protein RIB98_14945 [Acidimicrobiales bacterium]
MGRGIGYRCEGCGFEASAGVGWGMAGIRYAAYACGACRAVGVVPVESWADPTETDDSRRVELWQDRDGCPTCASPVVVLGDDSEPTALRWPCPACGEQLLARDPLKYYLWD